MAILGRRWRAARAEAEQTAPAEPEPSLENGHLEWVHVSQIRLDPQQPRTELQRLGITPANILEHRARTMDLADPEQKERAAAFSRLMGLAASIKSDRLHHPITLFSDPSGERYIIAEGERRYLAHVLLGEAKIPAIIHGPRPSSKRVLIGQLIENIQRVDLSLAERLAALTKLNELHRQEVGKDYRQQDLVEALGLSKAQVHAYYTVLHGPEDVRSAIAQGQIRNLDTAVKIVKLPKEDQRAKVIDQLVAGKKPSQEALGAVADLATDGAASKKSGGRPLSKIQLGSTQNPAAVRQLMEAYLGAEAFGEQYGNLDWQDLRTVSKAWKRFWRSLEGN